MPHQRLQGFGLMAAASGVAKALRKTWKLEMWQAGMCRWSRWQGCRVIPLSAAPISPLRPNFPNESAVSFERGVKAELRYILPRIAAEAFA